MNKPIVIFGAAAAILLLTTRKANAATAFKGGTAPVQTSAILPPSNRAYLQNPSAAARYTGYSPQYGNQQDVTSQALGFGTQLLKTINNFATPFPAYNAQNLGQAQSAEQDGNAGQQVAQDYYLTHKDEFIAPTPDYAAVDSTPWAQAAISDPTDY